ncbi:hypothetical protein evm_001188 [Chilo suppressalis]|nr:hypothetical protein evm_001188 [Chilo suppressalis]
MKITTLLLCTIFSRTAAWFFDDFQGVFASVENSVGKLFTDVVTDVEESIDCTVLAVKQVLALGVNYESSDYDVRCRGLVNTKPDSVKESIEKYSPTPPVLPTSRSSYPRGSNSKPILETLSQGISDSVKNVKEKMLVIEDKHHDTHTKILNVKNETDRLSEIGMVLHGELNNLTKDVKKALSRVETDYIHPTVDNIWQDIKTLHDIESTHTNARDTLEVRHTLREILTVLSSKNDNDELIPQDPEKIYKLIKDQFKKMKEKDGKPDIFDTIVDTLSTKSSNNNEKKFKEEESVMNKIPLTFKDVAKRIMKATKNDISATDSSSLLQITDKKPEITNNKGVTDDKTDGNVNTNLPGDFSDLLIPNDDLPSQAALLEAKRLIEESKKDEVITSKLFKVSEDIGVSVFDSSDFFSF